MPMELELTSLRLSLQAEELKSTDIPQRINALLALKEQRSYALENLKKRQQSVKKYFEKRAKSTTFAVDEKVLLWYSTNADRGKHTKFQKLCLVPYIIAYVVGINSYFLKYMDG
jgi:CRISPR/Cas system CMR subunit Cmr6 (Cas7 group RAMP superfamily)